MARQWLTHFVAYCHDCPASCEARNALGWSHQHVNRTGHNVAVELGYVVRGEVTTPVKARKRAP